MNIRDHYVVVPITPEEVRFEHESLLERLSDAPIVGVFIRALLANPRAEQHAAMVEALDDRLGRIERGLRELDGCNARQVAAADAAILVAEFWAGESLEYGERPAALFGTNPFVGEADP
jgi:hypothetical protein